MGAASAERSERGAIAEFGAGGRGSKVGRPLADGERGGGHHPERAVRLAVVVVLAPVLDQDLRLGEAGEQLHREELVADASAEALDVRAFREAFGVPKEFRPIRAISVGYPAEPAKDISAHRRPEEEVIHRRHWNAHKGRG